VYLSYFVGIHHHQRGPWWPDLDERFGVKKLLRYGLVNRIEGDTVSFVFERGFGCIAEGARLEFAVAGNENSRAYLPVEPVTAEVNARDERGRPALLEQRVGQGRFVLCTYPIEHMAARTSGVNPEPTWQLYAALAEIAGVSPPVRVADPRVVVGEMRHKQGRRFVWFLSQHDAALECSPIVAAGELRELEGGPVRVPLALEAFGARVLELRSPPV